MTLRIRTLSLMLAVTALVALPASASAAPKKHAKKTPVVRETSKPTKKVAAPKPTSSDNGLGNTLGLGPSMQIAAMQTAINAAPAFYAGMTTGCLGVTPMLANQQGTDVMAGNFRDAMGNCYIWLNLQQSSELTGSEICKTTLHEMGHLNGLQHSTDPNDVMYAPFQTTPIPAPCAA